MVLPLSVYLSEHTMLSLLFLRLMKDLVDWNLFYTVQSLYNSIVEVNRNGLCYK